MFAPGENTMVETPGTGGMDRRSLLKKSAVAGALVWAAPAVTNMSVAHATNIPGDGRFTNCFPRLGYQLVQTGSNCSDYNNDPDRIALGLPELDPACCDQSSYGIVLAEPSCGPQCSSELFTPPGQPLPINLVQVVLGVGGLKTDFAGGCNAPEGFALYDPGACSADGNVTLRIVSGVRCEDGTEWVLAEDVFFEIPNCPETAPGEVVATNVLSCTGPGCP
jgi:hypothetical protein